MIVKKINRPQGVLFLINNTPKNSYLTKGDWQVSMNILPALVLLVPSDKTSINDELGYVCTVLRGHHHTLVNFDLNLPKSCLSAASALWNTSGVHSTVPHPSDMEIKKGIRAQESVNEANLKCYNDLFERLSNAVTEFYLHWKRRLLAMEFISSVMHPDHKVPATIVAYLLRATISDSIKERKIGRSGIMQCLRQHRVVYRMVMIFYAGNSLQ